ncbi:MAG TPA: hypothetical protein VFP70_11575 [Burkholderiales bacterium]|nr:hypothetical protein [Burkholderiales bacterium]
MKTSHVSLRRPVVAAVARPGSMRADRLSFLVGLTVSAGGMAIFLSDLIARFGATG